jgi:serine protease Do
MRSQGVTYIGFNRETTMVNKPTPRSLTLALVAFLCGIGTGNWMPSAEASAERPAYRLAASPTATMAAAMQAGPTSRAGTRLSDLRGFSTGFADAAAEVTPAVVRIQTERSFGEAHRNLQDRMREMFERMPEDHPEPVYPNMAGGTGVLVSSDGLILTNNHVIAGATRISVTLADKRVFDATVVGADPTTDIALIVVDEAGLPAARLGDSDRVRVGEWVIAVGNPAFHQASTLDFTVTSGIVSAMGRPLDVIRQELHSNDANRAAAAYAIEDFIQTDAAINPGNSGGPLVDLDGAVIGINTAIASGNGFNQGYGFAVPINMAKRVMQDLLEYGHVRRPLLGIGIGNIEPEDAQVYGLPRIAGVLVEDFPEDSPAERAGLRRHDVIVGVGGEAVERLGQFQRVIASHRPGDVVDVDVIRYGEPHRFQVRLVEADLGIQRVVRTAAERRPDPGIGLELVDLTGPVARERGFPRSGGALVGAVKPNSPAMRRGVGRGLVVREINREPIRSAAEAERILRAIPSGGVASLLLEDPRGATLIRNVRVP